MTSLPVELGIARPAPSKKRRAKRSKKAENSDLKKVPNDLKLKIFERDNFTCQCCGFVSKKYQDVHFLDRDTNNLKEDNLVTTCIFCHQCFYLDKVGDMRSGVLIWLPEITQTDLHHIARSIYVARISQGPVAEAARKALDTIMYRREEAKNRISTDDPYILATVMKDYLTPGHYSRRQKKLEGIRLFPLDRRIIKEAELEFNQFPQILAYWRSKDGPFGKKTPPQWISIYQDIKSAA